MKILRFAVITAFIIAMGMESTNAQMRWGRYGDWDVIDTVVSVPKYDRNRMYAYNDDFYVRIGFLGTQVEVEDNWDSWDRWDRRDRSDDDDWRSRRRRRSRNVEYYEKHDHGSLRSLKFEIGVNNWLDNGKSTSSDDLYHLRPVNSTFVGLLYHSTTYLSGPLYLEWSGGFNWYNFKFENAATRLDPNGGELNFYQDLFVPSPIKSKLKVTYLNFQAIPVFDLSRGKRFVRQFEEDDVRVAFSGRRGVRFGIGPFVSMKLGQKAKYNYKDNGYKKDKDRGGFFINNFKWGLRAQLGINWFDLFFSYDMSPIFEDGRGPSLTPFAFGISL